MFHFYHKVIEYQSFKKMKHTTFMFHFKFHVSLFKTLRERFHAPTEVLNRSHSVFVFLPQCFYDDGKEQRNALYLSAVGIQRSRFSAVFDI